MSGRLLDSRGAIIRALSASGLATALVKQEGRWQRHWHGRLRPVAIDHVVFFPAPLERLSH